jgi:leucyl/phenylalanyl-tRNA--protein transferase
MYYWLSDDELIFPHPTLANPDGILAVGGDLSPERIILAYDNGIFPWFNEEDPIIWWSPDPRFVLYPSKLKVSKSMRKVLRDEVFQITFDTAFEEVIKACSKIPRGGQEGTWITEDMVDAYIQLHELGFAHSVEVRQNGVLVGGLYGIALGRCFSGESMFAKVSNASKAGFITLVKELEAIGFDMIDCQTHSNHLESLGAESITRDDFLSFLEKNQEKETLRGNWTELI